MKTIRIDQIKDWGHGYSEITYWDADELGAIFHAYSKVPIKEKEYYKAKFKSDAVHIGSPLDLLVEAIHLPRKNTSHHL